MTDDLEAQAGKLVEAWTRPPRIEPDRMVVSLASWARRLVAESRAGALREAKTATVNASSYDAALEAICRLAAEAEPGAKG